MDIFKFKLLKECSSFYAPLVLFHSYWAFTFVKYNTVILSHIKLNLPHSEFLHITYIFITTS